MVMLMPITGFGLCWVDAGCMMVLLGRFWMLLQLGRTGLVLVSSSDVMVGSAGRLSLLATAGMVAGVGTVHREVLMSRWPVRTSLLLWRTWRL